jgi:UDP-glucose 4-epimerase
MRAEKGEGMRVIVTGGAGFIGSRLVRRLVEGGDEVSVADVAATDVEGARHVRASVLDMGAMRDAIRDVDLVVHLAGYVRDTMRRQPYEGTALQVQGTLNVLEACRLNGVGHIAYASSFYVYDGIPSAETVDEETPLDPLSMELFGSAKLMGEALCRHYAGAYGLDYTVFRLGPAYGAGDSSAVGTFLRTGLRGDVIDVWGRGRRRNQYTYVEDIVDAMVAGVTRRDEVYNVVSPESTSIRELAGLMAQEFGFETTFDESRPEGPSFPYMSADKAIDQLDWRPGDLRSGVRLTVHEMAERARGVTRDAQAARR